MTISNAIGEPDIGPLLRLNNEHAAELSPLDEPAFRHLVNEAFFARHVEQAAFLLALDESAAYESPNYRWFRERHARFVYVDRIAVAAHAQGRGLGLRLYEELFGQVIAAGHDRIVCEVNVRPPNTASDAFHARLGFVEIGQADIHGGAKTVRYLEYRPRG